MDITKAIIPAAGLGTRFLPYTKAVPKEMLPLLNKPALQYIVEEGLSSDIKQFYIISSRGKQAIENHFDADPSLSHLLDDRDKGALLSSVNKIIRNASFTYIRQSEPLGLGHAVWLARHAICKEYFGIFLPDDIIAGKQAGLAQLIRIARQEKASVIAVQEVPQDCVSSYGIISVKKQITPNLFQVGHLVEKPEQKDAPSNLAVIGRYVLSHKIFQALDDISSYETDEMQLTDGISQMMKSNEKVFAYKVQGTRYDIGNPIGWLKASIGFALQDPHYAPHIRKYIDELDTMQSFMYDNNKNIMHNV
ncbi:MAG: UTP--glucose-1-phosphate uridylyltransferase [Candidatus Dependentiae bacterium]